MKSTKSSSEKSTAIDDNSTESLSTRRLSENAHKVQIMLRRRREMMAAQGKLRIEENIDEKKPHKSDGISISNQKSEPTSEEYDDDEELPELTLTENSESYDSNDSLNNVVPATKDLMDKG